MNRASEPSRPSRVIKPETAITMRRMMEHVVLTGTGKGAQLDGYTSGGKTGSAQIFDTAAHAYTHKYNASFMGFAPVNNPAIVVVVTLNGSQAIWRRCSRPGLPRGRRRDAALPRCSARPARRALRDP